MSAPAGMLSFLSNRKVCASWDGLLDKQHEPEGPTFDLRKTALSHDLQRVQEGQTLLLAFTKAKAVAVES